MEYWVWPSNYFLEFWHLLDLIRFQLVSRTCLSALVTESSVGDRPLVQMSLSWPDGAEHVTTPRLVPCRPPVCQVALQIPKGWTRRFVQGPSLSLPSWDWSVSGKEYSVESWSHVAGLLAGRREHPRAVQSEQAWQRRSLAAVEVVAVNHGCREIVWSQLHRCPHVTTGSMLR